MNFERRFQSFQGRSAAAEAESPSARHAEIDTRIITQKGLAIAFASTVLQTQLVVLGEAVNAGARLHRFPEQRCINDADEKALEHGLVSWASSWGQIVFGRVGVVAA